MYIDFRLHFHLNEDGTIDEGDLEVIKSFGRNILQEKWEEYSDRAWRDEDFASYLLDDLLEKVRLAFEEVSQHDKE